MTREPLKNLRLENFQSPNQVLCYGAGIMGRTLAESYQRVGLNVVGFIDKYKQGAVETAFGALPIYSIAAAVQSCGKDILVIITIGHARIFSEIRGDLTAAGVSGERIYDWNLFNWLTVPSSKCYCESLFQNTHLASDSLVKCCLWGDNRSFNVEILEESASFEKTLESYMEKIHYYHEKALEGQVPLYCAGCPQLKDQPAGEFPQLSTITFAASAQCNAKCVYCNAMTETDLSKLLCGVDGYGDMFLTMLRYFEQHDLIAPQARIGFGAGEITISPKRKELLGFALSHADYRYQFYSNCAIYNEDIAQVLAQGPDNVLICDLDAGTAETYTLVKGYNYFENAVDNLEKYVSHGHVCLKYIVMPDFNTSQKDYEGTVRILKRLGLKELILSREFFHFTGLFMERKVLFEVARFKKLLEENGISVILYRDSFDARQSRMVEHLCRQLSKPPKGDWT